MPLLLLRMAITLVAFLAAFAVAAVAAALLPVSGRQQAVHADDPETFVCASLAHADIVMERRDPALAQNPLLARAIDYLPASSHLALGWGDLVFYRETPTWAEVRLSVAVSALAGRHPVAVRLLAIGSPANHPSCTRISLDAAGRKALLQHVSDSLLLNAAGDPQMEPGRDAAEAYALAQGRYSPFYTCNSWLAQGLAKAGAPYALFAPFSLGVMWPLRRSALRNVVLLER